MYLKSFKGNLNIVAILKINCFDFSFIFVWIFKDHNLLILRGYFIISSSSKEE